MPLDPSIILQAGHGVTPIENPMDQGMKALNMQQAMMQHQMQQQQFDQQQQYLQKLKTIDQNDPNAVMGLLNGTGKFKEAAEFAKSQKDLEASKVAFQNEILKRNQAEKDTVKGLLQAVGNSSQSLASGLQQGQIKPDQLGSAYASTLMGVADTHLQPQPGDTPFILQTKERMRQGMAQDLATLSQMTPAQIQVRLTQHINDAKTHEDWIDEAKGSKYAGFHAGADQIAYQVNPQGQARQVIGPDGKPLKVPPPMAAMMTAPGSQLTPEAVQMLAQNFKQSGDLTKLGSGPMGAALSVKVANEAAKDGPVDLAQAKQEFAATKKGKADFEPNGTSGKTISAINTMTEHLATARRMAEALQNGQFPIANQLGQSLGVQLGDNPATNFATIKQFLAGEVAKVATGGHLTEGEIHAAADRLNQAQSPAQLMGALDTMREVAGGKLIALNQDYKRLFGKSLDETGRLTPATKAAFQGVNAAHGEAKPTAASGPVKISTDADYNALPSGALFISPDGKTRRKP